jgi:polysaccharide biosynthesis transport protein
MKANMKADQSSIVSSHTGFPSVPEEEGGLAIGQMIAAVRRRVFLIAGVTVVVASLAQLKVLTNDPLYSAGFEILTESVTAESEVISSVPQTLSSRQQNTTSTETLDATKIRVLQSPNLLYPVVEQLKLRYPDMKYEAIAGNLSITTNGDTILSVSFSNANSQLVKDTLEALSQRYLNYSLEERQKDIRQGLKFVEEQLPELEKRVAEQQKHLERFRQRFNLIDPQSQAQLLSAQASTLAQQQLDTQTQLEQARSLYTEIRAELSRQPTELAASSALSQSPRYQKLLDQLLDIDTKLAQEAALYLEASSEIQVLQEQRRNLEPLLQWEVQRVERNVISNIRELEYKNQAIAQSIAAVNQQIRELSTITRQYNDIQRGLEIATNNLNQFLAKQEGLRIEAAQRQIPWQLLTPPGEPIPSSASVKQTLILGIILGGLLGIGAALLLDRISNIVSTARQVRSITKLPVLGVIPLNRDFDNFEALHNTVQLLKAESTALTLASNFPAPSYATPFQEAFRILNANIRLLNPDTPVHSITVSSPTSENGKTTVSIHLALTAAAMGQRVLLIDTDLRRPQLHHRMKLSNAAGLTDVIASEVSFHEAIHSLPWEPNVSVLTSGTAPPDSTKILASKAMNQLIKEVEGQFDLIIYDTPPLLGLADVYLLAAQTDGLLLVVRLNQLKQSLLNQTMDELQISKIPVLGSVVNASEEVSFDSYSYYQPRIEQSPPEINIPLIGPALTHQNNQLKQLWDRFQKRI